MIKYYPYKSDKPDKKYYIITNNEKKYILVKLEHLILLYIRMKQGNKDINRHKNNENWTKSGINTAGWWSRWILWHKPTMKESYTDIKRCFSM